MTRVTHTPDHEGVVFTITDKERRRRIAKRKRNTDNDALEIAVGFLIGIVIFGIGACVDFTINSLLIKYYG